VRKMPYPDRPLVVAYVEHNSQMGGSVLSLRSLLHGLRDRVEPIVVQFANAEFGSSFSDLNARGAVVPLKAFDYRKPSPYSSLGRLGVEMSVLQKYVTYTLPLIWVFYSLFRRYRPALIHLNNHVNSHRAEIIAAGMAGIPCVCHLRQVLSDIPALELRTSRFVSNFIAVSQSVKTAAVSGGLSADRVSVVFNGIDFPSEPVAGIDKSEVRRRLGLKEDGIVVVTVGRLEPIRGMERIAEIWPSVVQHRPDCQLVIVGEGSERDRLATWFGASGTGETVHMVGHRDEVWDYLRAGDVYISSVSVPEAFGRALVEAMGMGLAVVAPAWGSTDELIEHGVTGLAYEPLNTAAMRQAIVDVVNDSAFRQQLAAQARVEARRRFGMEQYVEGVWDVYREVLGEWCAID